MKKLITEEIKKELNISDILRYYGGKCTNLKSGAWWCIIHEAKGKQGGHKTPSLVAKNEVGTATCMSQGCFQNDDVFSIIAKMEGWDLKRNFQEIKKKLL